MPVVFLLYFTDVRRAVWIWARRRRRDGWGEAKLIYEDPREAVTDLGIKDLAITARASGHARETAASAAGSSRRHQPAHLPALASAFPYEFRNAYGDEC